MADTFDIEETTLNNENYRWVYRTSKESQLVFMSLDPGSEIGMEVHPKTTQFIRIEAGEGISILNGKKTELNEKAAIFIPSGTRHNIINTGKKSLKLYTIYSAPIHPANLIQKSKAEEKKKCLPCEMGRE